jgi:hypothetical protein
VLHVDGSEERDLAEEEVGDNGDGERADRGARRRLLGEILRDVAVDVQLLEGSGEAHVEWNVCN